MNLTTLDPSWATALNGSSWVSFENTVCPGCSSSSPVYDNYMLGLGMHFIPGGTTYEFMQDFVVPAGYQVSGGTLLLLSDDTVAVNLVNSVFSGSGIQVIPNDGYSHFCNCSPVPADPVSEIDFPAMNMGSDIKAGQDNQLVFAVTQGVGQSSYGVDWTLTLNLTPLNIQPIGTPEPATLSMFALGSLGLLFLKRRL